MKRTSLFIPEQLLAAYAALAKKRGTPMAELIRAAMEMWLAQHDWHKANPTRPENGDGTD